MGSFIRKSLSLSALYIYVSALSTLFSEVNSPLSQAYGGHMQFLTVLGVYVSAISQFAALVSELTGLRTAAAVENVSLKISAPVEVLISILYWSIKFVNPSLLLDPAINIRLDPILDRKLHLYPALFQVTYAIYYPSKLWSSKGIIEPTFLFGAFATAYYYWTKHTASINGWYPYPLLGMLDDTQRIGLFAGSAVFGIIAYKIIQYVQSRQKTIA